MCSSGGGWASLGQWHPAFSSLKELKQKNVSRSLLKIFFFPFLFGIMVSSRIPCLNKSFSVIEFEPSFYSSSTYNYPSVSKGEPCHPCLWQRPKWSDMKNGKNTAWTWYCGVFESIVLNLADTMLSVIVLMKALFIKWRQILFYGANMKFL